MVSGFGFPNPGEGSDELQHQLAEFPFGDSDSRQSVPSTPVNELGRASFLDDTGSAGCNSTWLV